MPLTLNCPKCHKPFRVRDESVGGRVKCPSCGAVLQVPSALSAASQVGLDLPKIDLPPGEVTGAHRPVAEDVPRPPVGSMNDVMLGGPGNRLVTEHTAGVALPGPPSIKGRFPIPGAQDPPPPAPPPPSPFASAPMMSSPSFPAPMIPAPSAPSPKRPVQQSAPAPTGDAAAWSKVKRGLGMVRWGVLLCMVPILAGFGHGAWAVMQPEVALKPGPGFLGKAELTRANEIALAYTLLPLGLAGLLLFFGRLKCGAAPAESHAKGLIRFAAFFTFLGVLSIAAFVAVTMFDAANKMNLPPHVAKFVGPIASYLIVPSALLADLFTLLFLGQIGWPLGRPGLQKGVASLFFLAIFAPAAIAIGHLFYPVWDAAMAAKNETGSWAAPFGGSDDGLATRSLVWAIVPVAVVLLILVRYAGLLGSAKRAAREAAGE